jgi:hypothetical protein
VSQAAPAIKRPRSSLEDGAIKARIAQLQTRHILPVNAAAESVSRLAIGKSLSKLQYGHECEAPRGECRLSVAGKERREVLIGE